MALGSPVVGSETDMISGLFRVCSLNIGEDVEVLVANFGVASVEVNFDFSSVSNSVPEEIFVGKWEVSLELVLGVESVIL